jgi:tetratricopeptide (TPR) repeat protein
MSWTAANLLWQSRLRGVLPAAGHNVSDTGESTLLRPDEFENRTYQVVQVTPDGAASEVCAVSVETLHKADLLPDGSRLVGLTNDDLYLFEHGRKTRVTADRRVTYTDACLSPGSGAVACAYADSFLEVHGIAYVDGAGRMVWAKNIECPVNRVALGTDGRYVACGLQDGQIVLAESSRRRLWECAAVEPITALALPAAAPLPVAGSAAGTVMALDEDGGFRWRAALGLPVIAVAVDAAGERVAAIASTDGEHLLVCLGPAGTSLWEHGLEGPPSGLALSPGGEYLLVTLAGGVVSLFETERSHSHGERRRQAVRREWVLAREAASAGDLCLAVERAGAYLALEPADAAAASEAGDWRRALVREQRTSAAQLAEAGDFEAALNAAEEAFRLDPWDPELFAERLRYRTRGRNAALERARQAEAAGQWEKAEDALEQALALDPGADDARDMLARVRAARAQSLQQEGDQRAERGELLSAIELWRHAETLAPSDALAGRLRNAEVQRCLTRGRAFYEAGRLPEAAFQLRKVLALEPHHEEAQRYLGYAQGAAADNQISDRFSRLE